MTIKHKRFKNYQAAEDAALKATEQLGLYCRALRAVIEEKVHWLERYHARGLIRVGLAWPDSPCGGVVIYIQAFPTNSVYEVLTVDAFVEHAFQFRHRDEEVLATRALAQEVAMLRNRLIDQAEDTHATRD